MIVVSREERPMFVRTKPAGPHKYLQVVESFREGRKVRQRVVATLGRLPDAKRRTNVGR
jgi:hypothetical protein